MEINRIIFMVTELLAAIFGTIYITKYRADRSTRYFVFFLWFTVFVELFGVIPTVIENNENLSFLKNTLWYNNSWLYSIYAILNYVVYIVFFSLNITNKKRVFFLKITSFGFIVFSIIYYFFTEEFFKGDSSLIKIVGTILLFLSVFLYFLELLSSDKILKVSKILPFYIAIGSILFYLCATPFFIFLKFFKTSEYPEFVKLYGVVVPNAVIFMYTCYIIGFIVCLKKNKSY